MPRHETYFWDFVIFLVEDTFFRVPKYKFSQSSGIFGTTFSLPLTTEAEGSSEENPFRLKGVKEVDFFRFLTVLYPVEGGAKLHTKDEWLSVLKLSIMWDFRDLKDQARDELVVLITLPIDRVLQGRAYDLPKWVCSGYWELCTRNKTISEEEAKKLGYQTAYRLELVRERGGGAKRFDYAGTIRGVFEDEFKGVDVDEKWFRTYTC